MADHMGMTFKDINRCLNRESGLKGLCGTNDMREIVSKKNAGDERAEMALDVFAYRIKKYIGAYFAAMGHLDALVFTAGIGENSPIIRERSCRGLHLLGIDIDTERNNRVSKTIREISPKEGGVRVLVIPTNEELKIAQETQKVVTDFLKENNTKGVLS
jgi:acetate kinase